jgi:hypothetical protein
MDTKILIYFNFKDQMPFSLLIVKKIANVKGEVERGWKSRHPKYQSSPPQTKKKEKKKKKKVIILWMVPSSNEKRRLTTCKQTMGLKLTSRGLKLCVYN